MGALKILLTQRTNHAKKRGDKYKEIQGENPSRTNNYRGGWSAGYWDGKLSALEDLLDEIEEMERK